MKRTAEIILGVIGAVIYGLTAAIGGFMIYLQNNKDLLEASFNETAEQNPEIGMADMEAALDMLGSGGWLLTISSIVAIILGIVAMILLRGNKKPVISGIIFIATAVIVAIITVGVGIIPGIFYLIAGILCLVRKPARIIES